jgi:hypothetical protein
LGVPGAFAFAGRAGRLYRDINTRIQVDQAVKHLIPCEKKISGMTISVLSSCEGDVYALEMTMKSDCNGEEGRRGRNNFGVTLDAENLVH